MARRPASSKKSKQVRKKRAAKRQRKAGRKAAGKAAPPKAKWVYTFGGGKAEGRAGMKDLLGGKGANLAEMANLGLPVPPGFTITTEVCTHYYANAQDLSEGAGDAGRRRRSRISRKHHRQDVRRPRTIRCWCRCAPARAPRCRA